MDGLSVHKLFFLKRLNLRRTTNENIQQEMGTYIQKYLLENMSYCKIAHEIKIPESAVFYEIKIRG